MSQHYVHFNERGRTIIETLGVLVLLVILTLGGIQVFGSLYAEAISKSLTEEVIAQASVRRHEHMKQGASQDPNILDIEGPHGYPVHVEDGTDGTMAQTFWINLRLAQSQFRRKICDKLLTRGKNLMTNQDANNDKSIDGHWLGMLGIFVNDQEVTECTNEVTEVRYLFSKRHAGLGIDDFEICINTCCYVCPKGGICSGKRLQSCTAGYKMIRTVTLCGENDTCVKCTGRECCGPNCEDPECPPGTKPTSNNDGCPECEKTDTPPELCCPDGGLPNGRGGCDCENNEDCSGQTCYYCDTLTYLCTRYANDQRCPGCPDDKPCYDYDAGECISCDTACYSENDCGICKNCNLETNQCVETEDMTPCPEDCKPPKNCWNREKQECVTCNPGCDDDSECPQGMICDTYYGDGVCCPSNQIWNPETGECQTPCWSTSDCRSTLGMGTGSVCNTTTNACGCYPGYYYDMAQHKCIKCPKDTVCTCPGGSLATGTGLCRCPAHLIEEYDNKCVCRNNWYNTGTECICPQDHILEEDNTCHCPPNMVEGTNGLCQCNTGWTDNGAGTCVCDTANDYYETMNTCKKCPDQVEYDQDLARYVCATMNCVDPLLAGGADASKIASHTRNSIVYNGSLTITNDVDLGSCNLTVNGQLKVSENKTLETRGNITQNASGSGRRAEKHVYVYGTLKANVITVTSDNSNEMQIEGTGSVEANTVISENSLSVGGNLKTNIVQTPKFTVSGFAEITEKVETEDADFYGNVPSPLATIETKGFTVWENSNTQFKSVSIQGTADNPLSNYSYDHSLSVAGSLTVTNDIDVAYIDDSFGIAGHVTTQNLTMDHTRGISMYGGTINATNLIEITNTDGDALDLSAGSDPVTVEANQMLIDGATLGICSDLFQQFVLLTVTNKLEIKNTTQTAIGICPYSQGEGSGNKNIHVGELNIENAKGTTQYCQGTSQKTSGVEFLAETFTVDGDCIIEAENTGFKLQQGVVNIGGKLKVTSEKTTPLFLNQMNNSVVASLKANSIEAINMGKGDWDNVVTIDRIPVTVTGNMVVVNSAATPYTSSAGLLSINAINTNGSSEDYFFDVNNLTITGGTPDHGSDYGVGLSIMNGYSGRMKVRIRGQLTIDHPARGMYCSAYSYWLNENDEQIDSSSIVLTANQININALDYGIINSQCDISTPEMLGYIFDSKAQGMKCKVCGGWSTTRTYPFALRSAGCPDTSSHRFNKQCYDSVTECPENKLYRCYCGYGEHPNLCDD